MKRALLGAVCAAGIILATGSSVALAAGPVDPQRCVRDSLGVRICQSRDPQVVYLKYVDGHAVLAVCLLGIALCLGWLIANHKHQAGVGGQDQPD